ncbi:MAG: methylmalonyl-CoA mutase family protein [Deltaproteobacteria bacterium]|nr:methylmalonyl-CoA mutase family protein [Deltaproteobacteria bacterium]
MSKIRFITATSLFDGHDAAIHIIRRILQSEGAEVIHLGHNRSAQEVVQAAVQEDAQGIAISSYQGGHVEYFTYIIELLKKYDANHIKVFGGGGGVIAPGEIKLLEKKGVSKIFSPDDGLKMGLVGMIRHMIEVASKPAKVKSTKNSYGLLAREISKIEADSHPGEGQGLDSGLRQNDNKVLGITGTGGAGKSSLIDELLLRYLREFPENKVAVLTIDPTRKRTGGALLGDRIRINSASDPRVFVRSMATRRANLATHVAAKPVLDLMQASGFDLVILETAGIGQSDSEIIELVEKSIYVMTPEYGASSQLEKIDMLDFADYVVINKFDKRGALDALRDVRKAYQRNRGQFDRSPDEMPVFGTCAHHFADPGTNRLFNAIFGTKLPEGDSSSRSLIPNNKANYLGDICNEIRDYHAQVDKLTQASDNPEVQEAVEQFRTLAENYQEPEQSYQIRGKSIEVKNHTESLSHLEISKVAVPRYKSASELYRFAKLENLPGYFPYTAGVFPFKRQSEDPTRLFAGEGFAERTNKRFHFLCKGQSAHRLSTAFDSVTLYGANPDERPDIYGKIGNAGVSVCSLDDAKRLYSGFDLLAPSTSVSMTINGPAPIILAYFMNAAIDSTCERLLKQDGQWENAQKKIDAFFKKRGVKQPTYRADELPEGHDGIGLGFLGVSAKDILESAFYDQVKQDVLRKIRGTVQADILKEDQAQNTCIFSTEFAMRMMGDVQEYFTQNQVRNFYSVSISGYHIAEAGANPITQLAFTLANGFTLVEYYRSRGLDINAFAPNLSFFFSNGLDPEYAVIGRVARRIWAIAMKYIYGADERSQKLKYHIQTSGRSLHAQEIAFNDIRTTLQALYAINDNCNSLHTNAYDEAITTPTEESVRRALAIQLIINRELGLTKNENSLQGSFFIEQLTDQVEEAVLKAFEALDTRGGVLGAMETMYQRNKIQEESLEYEHKKHSGELPIIGVNTFLPLEPSDHQKQELIRSTGFEKDSQVSQVKWLQSKFEKEREKALHEIQTAALSGNNLFETLMEHCGYCSLGDISQTLYGAGGAYRRNM